VSQLARRKGARHKTAAPPGSLAAAAEDVYVHSMLLTAPQEDDWAGRNGGRC
jgi:hypothetical protein